MMPGWDMMMYRGNAGRKQNNSYAQKKRYFPEMFFHLPFL
jgi:hypothetical protein